MAYGVCTKCGKPATCETQNYFVSYCDDCWKDFVRHEYVERIEFKPYYQITRFGKKKQHKELISFENEWNRYLKENGYET